MNTSNRTRPYFKLTDLIIIATILIIAASGFIVWRLTSDQGAPAYAYIRVNNEIVETINLQNLKEPAIRVIHGKTDVELLVSQDGVRFVHSDCPDKLCVHQGLIKSGQSAACLPAGVSVNVKGDSDAGIDGIVG